MRYLALTVCMIAVFAFGMISDAGAFEQVRSSDETVITEGWHHGGGRGRGGRGWGHGRGWGRGGCYY